MLVETPTFPAPTIDGKYRLEALIGEGAYGTVYRAVHLGLKKPFALKLLRASAAGDSGVSARFRREAEALGRLRHPAIVEVTDFGVESENGPPYLVMELLEGETLSDLLRAEGPLPLERALPILEAIAGAIDAAHGQGVLHRDLKPGNVLLGPPGGPVAKVLDFGLAELLSSLQDRSLSGAAAIGLSGAEAFEDDARLTATGALLGTPLYIAPELIEEPNASRASDLYSFGVIAYEMLAGVPPFEGSTGEVLAAHLRLDPPAPKNLGSALPPESWPALRSALAKDPAERPVSARALVEGLREAARLEGVRAWRRREIPRRRALAALLALPLIAAGALSPNPVWNWLEARAFDTGIRLSTPMPADRRIVLVTLDSPGPSSPAISFADQGPQMAHLAELIFEAGARGLAFDIIPPPWWSKVEPVQDLLLRHADRLTLVAASAPGNPVEGMAFVSPFTAAQLGPDRTKAMFGFIDMAADGDGVIRRGRTAFRTTAGNIHSSWAARAAAQLAGWPLSAQIPRSDDPLRREHSRFWLDYRIDAFGYTRVPIERAASVAVAHPEVFRERLVVLGGDPRSPYEDLQRVPRAPGHNDLLPGILLQALQIDTLARGRSVRSLDARPFALGAAFLVFAAAAFLLCARRAAPGLAAVSVFAVALLTLSIFLFQHHGILLPWTPIAALWILGALLPWGVRHLLSRVPQP